MPVGSGSDVQSFLAVSATRRRPLLGEGQPATRNNMLPRVGLRSDAPVTSPAMINRKARAAGPVRKWINGANGIHEGYEAIDDRARKRDG